MVLTRTILAVLIALSVAMLPVAGNAATGMTSAEVSVSEPMDDCCPHSANPCEKAIDDCCSMAECMLTCVSFADSSFVGLLLSLIPATPTPSLVSQVVRPQAGSPPFRPPRV